MTKIILRDVGAKRVSAWREMLRIGEEIGLLIFGVSIKIENRIAIGSMRENHQNPQDLDGG